jgi:hypothetical protein
VIVDKALNPELEETTKAKAGAIKPNATAATVISVFFGPAYTIAIADNPDIKL